MDRRNSLGFLPIKTTSAICNLFSTGSNDRCSLISPMTELAINFEQSSMSTPRRRLSLSESGTPTPKRSTSVTESIESGIEADLPLGECPDFDSPTIENIRLRRKVSGTSPNGFNIGRRFLARRSISSPVLIRKPLEPLNFANSESPFKPVSPAVFEQVEEKHSDLSLCEMSDDIPELQSEFIIIKRRKKYTQRSHSAPAGMMEDLQGMQMDGFRGNDDGFVDEMTRDNECTTFSSSVPSNLMGLIAAPIIMEGDKENCAPFRQNEDGIDQEDHVFKKPQSLPCRRNRSMSFPVKRENPCMNSPISRRKRQRFGRSQSFYDTDPALRPIEKTLNASNLPSRGLTRSQSFDTKIAKSPGVDITKLFDMDNKLLIGDKTKEYCLPIIDCKHQDLKGISPETLASVMDNEYKDAIDEFFIIDCRYPYEYQGGHIKGAINIFEKQEMIQEFLKIPKISSSKRQVLIFHCEFSSKRGPSMCRFLRNKDRDIHQHCYPGLYYPEMYLLEGGYKEFFAQRKEYCEPQSYREMIDRDFTQELKLCSKRSKSWSSENSVRRRTGLRY